MSTTPEANFPPNVVEYVKRELEVRTRYRRELEQVPNPPEYMDLEKERADSKRRNLEKVIAGIDAGVIAIVKKHLPTVAIDENPEVTIANILAALPPPDAVRRVTQISARGQQ